MENETKGNEQRQRDIAALLARGLSRVARTIERTETTAAIVEAKPSDAEPIVTDGGDQ